MQHMRENPLHKLDLKKKGGQDNYKAMMRMLGGGGQCVKKLRI